MTYSSNIWLKSWQSISLIVAATLFLPGCTLFTVYEPTAALNIPIKLGRIQSKEENDVRVKVSVQNDEEGSSYFGVPLSKHGIQLIWMRIENNSDTDYWLMPFAVDPDYYSADEVAHITGENLPGNKRDFNTRLLRRNALPFFVKAQSTEEGFIFASYKRGGRLIDVRLSGYLHALRMRFAVLLPTESFDYEKSALREMYGRVQELPDMSVEQMREHLRGLPCCTSNVEETDQGDPLNVVLIGSGENMVAALTASGWDFTEAITVDSIRRMIGAAIAEQAFLTAPVSSLYLFGRKQDLALQRGRSTISQRNHMRLWLAPFRCEGKPVWIGQVSRDIGVKLTSRSPTLTTHIIDPVVDEAREYLFHSLLHQESVSQFAFVNGVGKATQENPKFNLTEDTYITDGMRMVLWLSQEPVPSHMALDLGWNESADPVREGKGEAYMIPALNTP